MSNGIPLQVNIFRRGDNGVPSTNFLANLQSRIDQYTHTITATFGFESMNMSFLASEQEAEDWLDRLMSSVVVSSPHAETVWEGYLTQVDAQFGQETRSRSLDGMANRVRVRYTTVTGVPAVTSAVNNTSSQALYGTKDSVLSLNQATATAANNLRNGALNAYAFPRAQPTTSATTGDLGEVRVTLNFAGWYDTLGWLVTSSVATSTQVTTTYVQNLLTSFLGFLDINNFLSDDFRNVESSGVSDTTFIADDTTYRDAIERLLRQGNSSNERLAWGVYEDRMLTIKEWNGASPDTITYQRYLGNSQIYTSGGLAVIDPWNVRPDAMYQVVNLLDVAPEAIDGVARFFVERVTCSISGDQIGVTLEPEATDSIDAQLAFLTRG